MRGHFDVPKNVKKSKKRTKTTGGRGVLRRIPPWGGRKGHYQGTRERPVKTQKRANVLSVQKGGIKFSGRQKFEGERALRGLNSKGKVSVFLSAVDVNLKKGWIKGPITSAGPV